MLCISLNGGQCLTVGGQVVKRDDKAGILPIGEWQLGGASGAMQTKKIIIIKSSPPAASEPSGASRKTLHTLDGHAAPEICRTLAARSVCSPIAGRRGPGKTGPSLCAQQKTLADVMGLNTSDQRAPHGSNWHAEQASNPEKRRAKCPAGRSGKGLPAAPGRMKKVDSREGERERRGSRPEYALSHFQTFCIAVAICKAGAGGQMHEQKSLGERSNADSSACAGP